MSRRRPSDDDLPPPGLPVLPVDDVPDPTATIPFRRSTAKKKPAPPAPQPLQELEPDPTTDDTSRPGAAPHPRSGPPQLASLHLPSMILGFSAGMLVTTMLCGAAFALFTTLG